MKLKLLSAAAVVALAVAGGAIVDAAPGTRSSTMEPTTGEQNHL
jgi:hypothetical protein